MDKVASLIVSIYISAFLYTNLFFVQKLVITDSGNQLFWNHLGIFIIILVPVFFLVNKLVSLPYARGIMLPLRTIVLPILLIGLVISLFYHIIPLDSVYHLPPQIDVLFASDMAFAIWLVAPIAVLCLI